jgi:sirohydrochlorin ferrochelatase
LTREPLVSTCSVIGVDTFPPMVAVAHGTRGSVGRRTVGALVHRIAQRRPGLSIRVAFVDVQPPELGRVLTQLKDGGSVTPVVVPLLLSTGHHVRVDIPSAVRETWPDATIAHPLGPDPALAELLMERLFAAGFRRGESVVLAAAGSSDPAAVAAVAETAQLVRTRTKSVVGYGFAAGQQPTVAETVQELRALAPGRRVCIATYLLAEGYFARAMMTSGADLVTAALGDAPALASLALARYDAARAASAARKT